MLEYLRNNCAKMWGFNKEISLKSFVMSMEFTGFKVLYYHLQSVATRRKLKGGYRMKRRSVFVRALSVFSMVSVVLAQIPIVANAEEEKEEKTWKKTEYIEKW